MPVWERVGPASSCIQAQQHSSPNLMPRRDAHPLSLIFGYPTGGARRGLLARIHIQTWRNRAADRPSTRNVIKKQWQKCWGSPALAGGAISILVSVRDPAGKSPDQPHPTPGLPWAEGGTRDPQVPPGPTILLK